MEETEQLRLNTKFRNENGLSYRRLGNVLDVDPATIALWERNKRLPSQIKVELIVSEIKNTLQK